MALLLVRHRDLREPGSAEQEDALSRFAAAAEEMSGLERAVFSKWREKYLAAVASPVLKAGGRLYAATWHVTAPKRAGRSAG